MKMTLKELANNIAWEAHNGQFRRDGFTAYIAHPARVAQRLKNEDEEVIAAAWLHDVLEDTKVTVEQLREHSIPESVIEAVVLLTKRDGEDYFVYLHRLRRNDIARKVKVADMLDNLSDGPTHRQIRRYAQGLLELTTSR